MDPSIEAPTIPFDEMMKYDVLIGTYPINTIKEGIIEQFNDYIVLSDTTDFVSIFYDQYEKSLVLLDADDVVFADMKRELLHRIHDEFNEFLANLFVQRIGIGFADDDSYSDGMLLTLYQYFILGAKENFLNVIVSSILDLARLFPYEGKIFLSHIDGMLHQFDPYIHMTIDRFIAKTGNDDIQQLFDDQVVTGNFLNKYSAKLYLHEDFRVEIINEINLAFRREK